MHKTTRLVGLFGALALIAAACSGSATPTPSAAPSAAPSVAAPSAEAPSVAPSVAAYPTGNIKISFWTKEGESDGSLQFVKKLTADYTALHSNVTFEVTNKDVEKLREEFQTTSLAGNPPDLLWTVADHVGPFTAADLLLPLDGLVDTASYVPNTVAAVTAAGQLWGVPISNGNQLMLLWNKSIAGDTAPADTDALVAAAKQYTDAASGKFGLVFNQTESFWLVPFIGGFGGSVFDTDGKTPTLDTPAMVSALQLLYNWKFVDKIVPKEADYNGADGLFKSGKAAFIINGDWSLGGYADPKVLGSNLGVAPLPKITGADSPKPYTAGAFFMVSKNVAKDADKQTVILDFMKWATAKDQQVALVKAIKRLPANAEALADPIVTGDPLLAGAAQAVQLGIPQPTNLEMRCVFDSMTTGVRDLFAKDASDPAAIAAAMQKSANAGVAPGGECAAQ